MRHVALPALLVTAFLAMGVSADPSSALDSDDTPHALSTAETDELFKQVAYCLALPSLQAVPMVRINIQLKPDGSLHQAILMPDQVARYNSDTAFRAVADSAIRAIYKCSPLAALPPPEHLAWRTIEFDFDPQELLKF